MSPRPKNPPPDRRQDIIEAALRVFSTKGYKGSTNAEIARHAGVTPAALYYYFASKADLFKAALTERKSAIFGEVERLPAHIFESPLENVFPVIADLASQLAAQERTQAILRILLLEGPRNPELIEMYQANILGQFLPLVLEYFQHQMDLGRITSMDPRLCGLMLAGSFIALIIARDVLKFDAWQDLTNEMLLDKLAAITLPALTAKHS